MTPGSLSWIIFFWFGGLRSHSTCILCLITSYIFTYFDFIEEEARTKEEDPLKTEFHCDQCEYFTTNPYYINRHKQYKHEEKTFFCHLCEYGAASKDTLKRHKQSKHEGVKYPCDHCDFAPSNLSSLKRHVKRKHVNRAFPCDQCNHVSSGKGFLMKHIKVKHSGSNFINLSTQSSDGGGGTY